MRDQLDAPPPAVDRSLYIILALLVGFAGAHNFYAHRIERGIAQLFLGVMSIVLLTLGYHAAWMYPAALIPWIILDIFTVKP